MIKNKRVLGPNLEKLYHEAINILEMEFAKAYEFELEQSSLDMVEIEEIDVTGS